MSKPKGAKTKRPNAYAGRSARVRARFGQDCYQRWGNKGGNPVLVKKEGI